MKWTTISSEMASVKMHKFIPDYQQHWMYMVDNRPRTSGSSGNTRSSGQQESLSSWFRISGNLKYPVILAVKSLHLCLDYGFAQMYECQWSNCQKAMGVLMRAQRAKSLISI